jgi:hypothetical protein
MNVKNFEEFVNEDYKKRENPNHGILLKNNKRFWIGSVNVFDGKIEEVHTYEKAEDCDFHHSFYFSMPQLEKIKNEECMVFWVDEDGINGQWSHGEMPIDIIGEIEKQIKID